MSLKNSSNLDNLKYEYIYGSIHKDGRRSFRSLDNLIKDYELAASTVYRHSSKEQWKDQRISFRAELIINIGHTYSYGLCCGIGAI